MHAMASVLTAPKFRSANLIGLINYVIPVLIRVYIYLSVQICQDGVFTEPGTETYWVLHVRAAGGIKWNASCRSCMKTVWPLLFLGLNLQTRGSSLVQIVVLNFQSSCTEMHYLSFSLTFNCRSFQSAADPLYISVGISDFADCLSTPELHQFPKVHQRAAKVPIMIAFSHRVPGWVVRSVVSHVSCVWLAFWRFG